MVQEDDTSYRSATGVPYSTLKDRLDGRYEKHLPGPSPLLHQVEEELRAHLEQMALYGYGLVNLIFADPINGFVCMHVFGIG